MKREEIVKFFQDHKTVKVVFTKKDGSIRTMLCTRDLEKIPTVSHPKGEGHPIESTVPVYDLEANGWRSFSIESLISIEEA